MKVALWGNTSKPLFWELLPKVAAWMEEKGQELYLTTHIHKRLEDASSYTYSIIEKADDFSDVDFVLAMGGDGTILSAARGVEHRGTPIFGVHLGGLGFLAEGTVENIYTRLEVIVASRYSTFPRVLVEATIEGDSGVTVTSSPLIPPTASLSPPPPAPPPIILLPAGPSWHRGSPSSPSHPSVPIHCRPDPSSFQRTAILP